MCVGDFDKLIQIVETAYLTKLETKIRDLLYVFIGKIKCFDNKGPKIKTGQGRGRYKTVRAKHMRMMYIVNDES